MFVPWKIEADALRIWTRASLLYFANSFAAYAEMQAFGVAIVDQVAQNG